MNATWEAACTKNLTEWQAACSKLDYLSDEGYHPGDTEYDTARESIRKLQRELRILQLGMTP